MEDLDPSASPQKSLETSLLPRPPFKGRLLLRIVLCMEALLLAISVAIGLRYGNEVLGHWLVAILIPSLGLLGLGLCLALWHTVVRLRWVPGWLLLLGQLAVLGLGVAVLRIGMQMQPGQFLSFTRQELGLFLQALTSDVQGDAVPLVGEGVPKAIEAGSQDIGEVVALEVPEGDLGRGDSLVVKGAQEWDVVVHRDTASEAMIRTLVNGGRRVPLVYPDSGEAWTANGEVLLLQCHHEPVAAVSQLGLCPQRTAEASVDQGFGCEEPVVPHHLIVNLRSGKRRLLSSEISSDAALDSAQAWFQGERCAE